MWLRLGEDLYIPYSELVGFFGAESLEIPREGKVRSVALLRDGRSIALSTSLKTLEKKTVLFLSDAKEKVPKRKRTPG
jgi:hypothetical protein